MARSPIFALAAVKVDRAGEELRQLGTAPSSFSQALSRLGDWLDEE